MVPNDLTTYTIPGRFFDLMPDEEVKKLIEWSEYLVCRRFLKGRWEKFSHQDRFHGVGFFEGNRRSKSRHCHIIFYIPFHMMSRKNEDGWSKMTGDQSFLTMAVRQQFISSFLSIYPRDPETMKNFIKSFTNKDGVIDSYRRSENTRLTIPYIQTIKDTEEDRKRIVDYAMKETHWPDRFDDIFFSNNKQAVTH